MSLVFIGLGSNLGDGRANLQEAWQRLGTAARLNRIGLSSPYLSTPVGMTSTQWFTNAVGVLQTSIAPDDLLAVLLNVERDMGRDRSLGKDRMIDLDILYYDDLVCHTASLILPHPEIANRLFVLAPLVELAPDHLHPVAGQSSRQMRRLLAAAVGQEIKKITWND
ncbi:MAG: 2-amino-4-hydroxy-6-hydroxymethyldihydropteridine diphosphokinase [Deltaproteobacteria bacterium]|nr:2-amino-4-hydroxy-6-hydroxymethyldihydropteridine diphosphokinase [Deltaproteobacteria bacterium]